MSDIHNTFIDQFENNLYNFLGNNLAEPSVPDNLEKYKIKSKNDLVDKIKQKLNSIDKLDKNEEKVPEIQELYNYIYANIDNALFSSKTFYETTKLKLVEFYFVDPATSYAKKYINKFSEKYFELIFNQQIWDYVINIYLNVDNNKHYSNFFKPETKKRIMDGISKRNTFIKKKQNVGCLTWQQAMTIHCKTMEIIKNNIYKNIYSEGEYIKHITDLNGCVMSRIKSGIYDNKLYIDQLFELTQSFKKNCGNDYAIFCYSETVSNMKIELLSEYATSNNVNAVKEYYKAMYGKNIDADIGIFKYFATNQQKYDELTVKNMKKVMYDLLVDEIIKKNGGKNIDDNTNQIKMKLYCNYNFTESSDEEKDLYQTYNNALFDKQIENNLDDDLIIFFAKNMDKLDESHVCKFKDHVCKKLLLID